MNARALVVERLEPRAMLAVDAADDLFEIDEGRFLDERHTVVFPSRSGWSYFTDIGRNGENEQYPNHPADLYAWTDREYDTSNPLFGTWRASAAAPFIMGNIDALGGSTPRTLITARTALFRKSFTLPQSIMGEQITKFTVGLMCDDGCAGYLNGIEVFRFNLDPGSIEAIEYADSSINGNNESRFRFFDFDIAALGVSVFSDATNLFAVEVHQAGPNSDDMAFDAFLCALDSGLKANDSATESGRQLQTFFLPLGGDPAIASGTQGDVYDAATSSLIVGSVTIDSRTGEFLYIPVAGEFGGDATFQYVLRDADSDEFDVGTVTLRIAAHNDAPVAKDDIFLHVTRRGPLDAAEVPANVLVGFESTWRYQDDNTDQNTTNPAWNDPPQPAVDPAVTWRTGTAIFGYGEPQLGLATHMQIGSEVFTIPAYFFRREFDAPDDVVESLRIRMLYDDCAVVFINGLEVVRTFNFPAGENWQSRCTGVRGFEYAIDEFRIPAINLRPTGNVIAVELHNQQASADTFFDLELANAPYDLLTNDTDGDDARPELRVEVVDASQFTPEVGSLDVRSDGSFTFTPANELISGDFSFTYRVHDDGGPWGPAEMSNVATATIRVSPCDCDPDLNNDGNVDAADLAVVAAAFGDRAIDWLGPLAGDANGDDRVSLHDVILIRNRQTVVPALPPEAVVTKVYSDVRRPIARPRPVKSSLADVDATIVARSLEPISLTAIPRRTAMRARVR